MQRSESLEERSYALPAFSNLLARGERRKNRGIRSSSRGGDGEGLVDFLFVQWTPGKKNENYQEGGVGLENAEDLLSMT